MPLTNDYRIQYDTMTTVENWYELTRIETGFNCITMKVWRTSSTHKPENSPNIENVIRIRDWTRLGSNNNLRADPIPFAI